VGTRAKEAPWQVSCREDRDATLLDGVRLCAEAIPGIVVAFTAYMLWFEPQTAAVRGWLAAAFLATCAAAWSVRRLPVVTRRAVPFAAAFVLALVATTMAYWRVTPQAADSAASTFIIIQMGTALLFPWGPIPQAAVSTSILAGYAWLVAEVPQTFQPFAAGMLVATVPLVLLAARLLDRYRAAVFRRSWQKDQLVSLARALGAELSPRQIAVAVIEHGVALLRADASSAALRTAEGRTYRVEAAHGLNGSAWLGFELRDDFGLARQIAARGVLVLPADDPANPLLPLLAAEGQQHALYTPACDGEGVAGVFAFTRTEGPPFAEEDRLLGRALADQASLALRTAGVVEALREANRLKSEFVSTVSHELRTPLNVILGFAEMGRDTGVDSAAREDCLARIEAAGRELLGLIESTLEIGRLEAGRQALRLEPIDLPAFWRELGAACARLPRRPGVVLEWSDAVPPGPLETDPRKLEIVVRNLVGNAVKFTERGYVRAEVGDGREGIVIRVSDTGIGIRAEDRESIFEMFRQADGSDARRYGGVGLGLYLVRRFVEQLGGAVTVESTVGVGTAFTVRLPRTAERGVTAPAPAA